MVKPILDPHTNSGELRLFSPIISVLLSHRAINESSHAVSSAEVIFSSWLPRLVEVVREQASHFEVGSDRSFNVRRDVLNTTKKHE